MQEDEMNIQKWLKKNTKSLYGKTVAITGSTGGLGRALCKHLASLGASLVLVDRNEARSRALGEELRSLYPHLQVETVCADLSSLSSVKAACVRLLSYPLDVFIHNAGAYSIPRYTTSVGYDNVYTINFISPYYMIRTLMPILESRQGKVVVVGSIAHRYAKSDPADLDFSGKRRASLVYGNAKRYLMFSLYPLFKKSAATLSVTHPGISFTGITAHYPKVLFAIIKYPMKLIFMKPRKASLSLLLGVFEQTEDGMWIGPRFFDVWGKPKKKRLKGIEAKERARIAAAADMIYYNVKNQEV